MRALLGLGGADRHQQGSFREPLSSPPPPDHCFPTSDHHGGRLVHPPAALPFHLLGSWVCSSPAPLLLLPSLPHVSAQQFSPRLSNVGVKTPTSLIWGAHEKKKTISISTENKISPPVAPPSAVAAALPTAYRPYPPTTHNHNLPPPTPHNHNHNLPPPTLLSDGTAINSAAIAREDDYSRARVPRPENHQGV